MKLEEYSNASDIKAENIPPDVLDELAAIFYKIFVRTESEPKKETA